MKLLSKTYFLAPCFLLVGFMLTACGGAREAIVGASAPPDEFAVVTRAPLSMPPDYGLRPPRAGAKRPQETSVLETAREKLLHNRTSRVMVSKDPVGSGAEAVILKKAGATNQDKGIRELIDREASIFASKDESFTDKIMFWHPRPKPGTIVDAKAEKKRLRNNAALGANPTTGRTPQITRQSRGFLEGVFK